MQLECCSSQRALACLLACTHARPPTRTPRPLARPRMPSHPHACTLACPQLQQTRRARPQKRRMEGPTQAKGTGKEERREQRTLRHLLLLHERSRRRARHTHVGKANPPLGPEGKRGRGQETQKQTAAQFRVLP